MAERIDGDNYCKDCKRSIYGEYKNCDVNIENNGKYVAPPNQECGCKIAEVKGLDIETVAAVTTDNAKKLFAI